MENKISISVIMLTYNRENMLSTMIESILAQTFDQFEFIIVDNGSTDRSGEIAKKYAESDERIQVITIEKSSIGKGRNIGISHATGDFIAFVDDDDACEDTYLEKLYDGVQGSTNAIAICATGTSKGVDSGEYTNRAAMELLLDRGGFNVGFPTKLIPRHFLEADKFDEYKKFDDIYLMPLMISKADKIVYIAETLYIVNRHDNNNSAWTTNHSLLTKEILEEYIQVYEKRTKWLCELFPEDEELWLYYKWSFFISMLEKIIRIELTDCNDVKEQLNQELLLHREIFLGSEKIKDFEKEWMREYV